ncbi:MAG: DNA (cytosine-5-)-methyltransferase [Actinobacteria bacterium]|nr:DNA (cytosine-5-)-methyltransferase [Actinomycetota bacterium]MCL6093229.1 DNA (cytosine-5-)-methyltransferase [Actinomycetota bacterium]
MAKQVLIRDLPANVKAWIEEESYRKRMTQKEFLLGILEDAAIAKDSPSLFDELMPSPVVIPNALPFTFIDIFAGIGGFRVGLNRSGGRCLWSCEYDKYSQKTYMRWFGEKPFGDINELKTDADIARVIPDHDLLSAGFPCQPFSIAGVSKKKSLGHAHGFDDVKQGNLFFKLAKIIEVKRPPVVFLENVKNLKSHDGGRTWDVIHSTLTEELNYKVFVNIIDAAAFVPQHRERVMIVCFDRNVFGDNPPFSFPEISNNERPLLKNILEERVDSKYMLSSKLWNYLKEYAKRHKAKGNGFGYGLVGPDDIARTMSARYYKDGSEILIRQNGKRPRRLTPLEAARLMGFDEERAGLFGHTNGFPQVVSDTQAYRQFGNAVVPAVIEAVGKEIVAVMNWHLHQKDNGCLLKRNGKKSLSQKEKDGIYINEDAPAYV